MTTGLDERGRWLLDNYEVERRRGPGVVTMVRGGERFQEEALEIKVFRRSDHALIARDRAANASTFCSEYGTARGPDATDQTIIDALINDESVFAPPSENVRRPDGTWVREQRFFRRA